MPLPQCLSIAIAADVQSDILAALEAAELLELDASGITEIDTAGLQLLLACHQYSRLYPSKLRMTAVSSVVQDAFSLAGLNEQTVEINEVASEENSGG